MEQPFPKYALFNGKLYAFVKQIEPIPGAKRQAIVICSCAANSDEASDERYVKESAWLEAACEFKQTAQKAGLVTSQSSAQEKITLFRSLFRGRPDVHAHGFRRKDGGIGYVPACANEWKRGTCPRAESPKAKCSLCSKQAFLPLTDSAIVRHFKGTDDRLRDVIGLYVLRDDSTTSVLVMDFDKNGWQDAVSAIRTVAKSRGLQASVERSRSGNGGHIWFFFERPISAKLARDFGSALITEAMRRTKTVKFDAYDRMFPAQTTIPEGGFGNLISLPFQGKAQREGNGVFVDEQFRPYSDQWLFLSRVEKIDEQAAQEAIDTLAAKPLGNLAKPYPAPWRHQPREPISQDSFSEPVDIVESDMIYVPESALNAKAADAVKRLAAFANPEFYRAQAMHQSVYGKLSRRGLRLLQIRRAIPGNANLLGWQRRTASGSPSSNARRKNSGNDLGLCRHGHPNARAHVQEATEDVRKARVRSRGGRSKRRRTRKVRRRQRNHKDTCRRHQKRFIVD